MHVRGLSLSNGQYILGMGAIFCWGIWKKRNNKIFKDSEGTRVVVLFRSILCLFHFWTEMNSNLEYAFSQDVVDVSDNDIQGILY
jgi:hypothetical protein